MKLSITFSDTAKNKAENDDLIRLIPDLPDVKNRGVSVVTVRSPDQDSSATMPDYFIDDLGLLIEVKEIHDQGETEQTSAWYRNVTRLKKALEGKKPKGFFLLSTPPSLRVERGKERELIEELYDAIQSGKSSYRSQQYGYFEIREISADESNIVFSIQSKAMAIDPSKTIYNNIVGSLAKANKQLGAMHNSIQKRILLLSNRYIFGDELSAVVGALSDAYDDLLTYKHIDEIWYQWRTSSNTINQCVYTKRFIQGFNFSDRSEFSADNITLLSIWLWRLIEKGDTYKGKVFEIMRSLLKQRSPTEIFGDSHVREEIVSLGNWLLDEKRYEDAIWLIEKFANDPDPESPNNYKGDPDRNYHTRILDGEDPSIITTVQGNLCWVVAKLAEQKGYVSDALKYTDRLLRHPNFYIKMNAIVPLTAIAARRADLNGWTVRPRIGEYAQLHHWVFYILEVFRKNPTALALGTHLCNVFAYYKDLSTEEAETVLSTLRIVDEAGGLFIYYALYRPHHYKEQNIDFDGKKMMELLHSAIKEGSVGLVSNISWQLWKILQDDSSMFNKISPLVALVLKRPYMEPVFNKLEWIIKEWINEYPEVCINWYLQFLDALSDDVEKASSQRTDVWLSATEEILPVIAQKQPSALFDIIVKLENLWRKGAYIGKLQSLFNIYRYIHDSRRRNNLKETLREAYSRMKGLNPKIDLMTWD